MSASHSTAAAPRRFQFNLATLLIVMAWIAVSCVALRTPTAAWSGAIFCLTLLALATSLLAVIYRTEGSRAFAVGFLVCGLGYATCLFVVEHQFTAAPLIQAPTTRLSFWLFEKLHANNVQTVTVPAGGMGGGGFGGGGMQPGGGGGFFSVDSSEQAVQNDADAAGAIGSSNSAGDPASAIQSEPGAPDDGSAGGTPGDAMGGDGEDGMGMSGGGMGMPMSGGMPGMGGSPGGMVTYSMPLYDSTNFTVIVHCTLAVLLGIIGGIIAQWLYCTRQKESRQSATPPGGLETCPR